MNNDFNTGRPPTWRVILYAVVVIAIPIYFFYPKFNGLSLGLKVVSVGLLISSVLCVFFIGIVMPMLANANRTWLTEHQRLIRILLAAIATITGLWKLFDLLHTK